MEKEITEVLKNYPQGSRDTLIPVLQSIQDKIGFLPEEAISPVASWVGIPTSKVYGVATFYDQFRFTKKGALHIRVCRGTACHVMGSSNILKELEKELRINAGEVSKDGKFSLEIASCIGACSMAPVIQINDTYYPISPKDNIKEIIQKELKNLNA